MARWHDLSPELRNAIYDLVLVPKKAYSNGTASKPKEVIGILAVNRAIRAEALPIWLSSNEFRLLSCLQGLKTGTCWTFDCSKLYHKNEFELWGPYVKLNNLALAGITNLTWTHHHYRLAAPKVVAGQSLSTSISMPQIELYVNGNECRVSVVDSVDWRDQWTQPSQAVHLARVLHAEIKAKEMMKLLEAAMKRKLEVVKFQSA